MTRVGTGYRGAHRHAAACLIAAGLAALISGGASAGAAAEAARQDPRTARDWFREGRDAARRASAPAPAAAKGRAKNVILFVGDGMGLSTVTAARIHEGQRLGMPGEEHRLSFESLPFLALLKTYSVNQQVADSAATITAMTTGVKTVDGAIAMDAAGRPLMTILEVFERAGRSTGVVTTSRLTHATPAGCYAHIEDRDAESDDALGPAQRARGARDIARQLVEWTGPGDGLEVALGGGRSRFLPRGSADPEDAGTGGARADGRDLTAEWTKRFPRAAYVWSAAQLDAVDASRTDHLLGLFSPSHMRFEADRSSDKGGEPALARMTLRALDILRRNPRGWFLLVEGGRIDHAHHDGNAWHALDETVAFAAAFEAARRATRAEDTLLVVTADHSHVMTIGGYPQRGNPILGLAASGGGLHLDRAGRPYTTLGYANGPGARGCERPDLRDVDTTAKNYRQDAAVPLESESHGGEDVPLYAGGPGAHMFHGVMEQNVVFHLILEAAGLQAPEP
jgi:alkaline phosphatase